MGDAPPEPQCPVGSSGGASCPWLGQDHSRWDAGGDSACPAGHEGLVVGHVDGCHHGTRCGVPGAGMGSSFGGQLPRAAQCQHWPCAQASRLPPPAASRWPQGCPHLLGRARQQHPGVRFPGCSQPAGAAWLCSINNLQDILQPFINRD